MGDIDANGIVNVGAKDKGTGKEQNIVIQSSGGLSNDQIENMVKDAEKFAEADKAKRDLIDQRNKAEAGIMDTELNEKLEALRADLTNDDVTGDDLREKWHELQKEVMSVFSEAYSKKAAENSGNESSEQPAEEK